MKVAASLAAVAALAACGTASDSATGTGESATGAPVASGRCDPGELRIVLTRPARCVPLGAPGSAVPRSSAPGCSTTEARKGFVRLRWRPAAAARAQRIVVTARRDGFETAQYMLGSALPPQRAAVTWTRLRGQAIHFWVVLTRTPGGWTASRPGEFVGPTCVADMPG